MTISGLIAQLGMCKLGVSHHIGGKGVWDGTVKVPNPLLSRTVEALQIQEHQINELLGLLTDAKHRLDDMLKGDDGQAWKEAERFMPKLNAVLEPLKGKQA